MKLNTLDNDLLINCVNFIYACVHLYIYIYIYIYCIGEHTVNIMPIFHNTSPNDLQTCRLHKQSWSGTFPTKVFPRMFSSYTHTHHNNAIVQYYNDFHRV